MTDGPKQGTDEPAGGDLVYRELRNQTRDPQFADTQWN